MSIVWDVPEIITDTSGGVIEVGYSVSKGLAIRTGTISFTPDPTSETYVDFATLIKSEVIDWVKDRLTQEEVDNLESQVTTQAANIDNTTYPSPTWKLNAEGVNKLILQSLENESD